jgi:tetratricopeptide (TPR) repeat protein
MEGRSKGRPFSCSKTAGIPLASELIIKIAQNPRFQPHIARLTPEDRANYGKLMACLGKNDRKELLSPYLNNAKVNWANIAIASMMSAGYVSRALTFNFDNVLARACGICGLYPATYDFVTGVSKASDHIVPPAIVHLHGQGYGLAMLNSEQETAEHAVRLRPLISQTLTHSPILVIGYSGEADAVFPVLKDEFDGSERLIWAGFSETPSRHVDDLLDQHSALTDYLGGADADRFLVELAQELGCWPPMIFENPLEHIRKEIEPIADFPSAGANGPSIDVLAALRSKLRDFATQPAAESSALEASLNVMKGEIDQIVDASVNGEDVPPELLAYAYFGQGNELYEQARTKGEPELFARAAEKYKAALRITPTSHQLLNNLGLSLVAIGTSSENSGLIDDAIEIYKEALIQKPDSHEILNNYGLALSAKAQTDFDAKLMDEASEKFRESLKIKPDKYEALNNWGTLIFEKSKLIRDPALIDTALAKYNKALVIKPDSHEALSNLGTTYLAMGRSTGDLSHFDRACEYFDAALKIKPDKHMTLYNWGNALSAKARKTKDPALFDEAAAKFAATHALKPKMAEPLNNWGLLLSEKARVTGNKIFFEHAATKYSAALKISPKKTYNMACISSILGDTAAAKRYLLDGFKFNTLPDRIDIEKDLDLDNIRDEKWFKDLLSRLS